jgi:hypothetical protein
MAASLLHAIALPELIATSLARYETLALELARNWDLLTAARAKLDIGTHIRFLTRIVSAAKSRQLRQPCGNAISEESRLRACCPDARGTLVGWEATRHHSSACYGFRERDGAQQIGEAKPRGAAAGNGRAESGGHR